ncbi:MAG TPA: membrane dipeptidase, partial [Tepidisphaeraceae bacterium]|nr:membrane dipeptidase [Tepidisphaeraceae bacterium]
EQMADEDGTPSVGLPDLRQGGVGVFCATIFCEPAARPGDKGYRSAEQAHAEAVRQLHWYQQLEQAGHLRLVRRSSDLLHVSEHSTPAVLLLMEGADPLRSPSEVASWFERGLRLVGLAWKRTRYAGGTGAPGPLSAEGERLVRELDACHMIHDVSHLAEQSFWQLLDLSDGPIIASHSNCRTIIPTDRQLSDEMIRALVARDAVIGINFYDRFLIPPSEYGRRRATLADVVRQVQHICQVVGNAHHVGLGTDMDGGFGQEHIPLEISSAADLPKLASALEAAGFASDDVSNIMGGNWMHFFGKALPA